MEVLGAKEVTASKITSDLENNVGCYMVEAARKLENVEVRIDGEKKTVKIALIGIKNCIRSLC